MKRIFSFGIRWQIFIFAAIPLFSWELRDDQWDKRKLRNNYTYLVEGKGGMGVLIGETEEMIFRVLGQPTRRSYGPLDELYFERHSFKGSIYLYKGIVRKIRFVVEYGQSESLKWKTAMGLTQQAVETLSDIDAQKYIADFYGNAGFLQKPGSLFVHSRGIHFRWSSNRLLSIEVFPAWDNLREEPP